MPLTQLELKRKVEYIEETTILLQKVSDLQDELLMFSAKSGVEAQTIVNNITGYETSDTMQRHFAKMQVQREQQDKISFGLTTTSQLAGQMRPQAEQNVINLRGHIQNLEIDDPEKDSILQVINNYHSAVSLASNEDIKLSSTRQVESNSTPTISVVPDHHQNLLDSVQEICQNESFLQAIRDRNYSQALRKLCAMQSLSLFNCMKPYFSILDIDINQPSPSNGKTALDWINDSKPAESESKRIIRNELIKIGAKVGVKDSESVSALNTQSIFVPSSNEGVITSQSIYNATMRCSATDGSVTLDSLLKKYKTPDKNVALRRAGHQGNVSDIELLINQFRADVNSRSSNGFTALDWAFYNNQMEPYGVFNTLCWLKADQTTLKPLLAKYTHDDEKEFPLKDLALSRAIRAENQADIDTLVNRYKADMDAATAMLDTNQNRLKL